MNLAPGHLHRNTALTLTELRRTLRRVTREFQAHIGNHQSQLAARLAVRPQTVQSWFKLGRISPWGALAIEAHFPEWKKERLRPDIVDWNAIKQREPGRI